MSVVVAPVRDVVLEGGYNLRDIGGYRTRDGKLVRRGRLFRSAALGSLTEADVAAIAALEIKLVVDLRTTRERVAKPNRGAWPNWARDYDSSTADLHRAVADPALTTDGAHAAMRATYDRLPEEQADAYAQLLRRIADDDLPLLFHCAVGKDRTGVAAALILDLLGVDRDMIMADYLLTNRVGDRVAVDAHQSMRRHNPAIDTAVLGPVVAADPAYLTAMFAGIETRFGSSDAYARARLGLSDATVAAMRAAMLTDADG